jgi:hypothetical protein
LSWTVFLGSSFHHQKKLNRCRLDNPKIQKEIEEKVQKSQQIVNEFLATLCKRIINNLEESLRTVTRNFDESLNIARDPIQISKLDVQDAVFVKENGNDMRIMGGCGVRIPTITLNRPILPSTIPSSSPSY